MPCLKMATGTAATFNAAIGSSNIANSLKLDWLTCKGGARVWRLLIGNSPWAGHVQLVMKLGVMGRIGWKMPKYQLKASR
jgi:hypothetical protein